MKIFYAIKALTLENSNSTLFYHFKNSLYHYNIPFYNISNIQKLFLVKYYFLIFLYYFFPTITFFQTWHDSSHFPGLSNKHFFTSLSPSTSSTDSTHRPMIHQSTYPNPSPHKQRHTHTRTQTINKATHTQTQTIKPSTKPHTH